MQALFATALHREETLESGVCNVLEDPGMVVVEVTKAG